MNTTSLPTTKAVPPVAEATTIMKPVSASPSGSLSFASNAAMGITITPPSTMLVRTESASATGASLTGFTVIKTVSVAVL